MPPPHLPLSSVTQQHRGQGQGQCSRSLLTLEGRNPWFKVREHLTPSLPPPKRPFLVLQSRQKEVFADCHNSWKPQCKHQIRPKTCNSRDYTGAYREYPQVNNAGRHGVYCALQRFISSSLRNPSLEQSTTSSAGWSSLPVPAFGSHGETAIPGGNGNSRAHLGCCLAVLCSAHEREQQFLP